MLLTNRYFLAFCVLVQGALSQSCTYSSNGYTLTLSSVSVTEYKDTATSFTYYWTPCANGYSCGSNGNIMTGQYNTGNGNCNKLAVWDDTGIASYDSSTGEWSLEYNNGAVCGSSPRITRYYLTCGTGSNMITGVTNPSGSCEYDLSVSGPAFCNTESGGGSSGGGGDSDEGLSGGWVFIIILLVVTFLYCTIGCAYNKVKVNPDSSWRDTNNIPNSTFWRTVPKWTWAGCCVTKEWIQSKFGSKSGAHQPITSDA